MSLNKAMLIGHAGMEPDIKEFEDGGRVAQFTLATTKRAKKGRDGREIPERTEWHNIVLTGGLAQIARDYIHKGDKLYIEGEIRTRAYEKDGERRFITEIYGQQLELLNPRRESSRPAASAPAPDPNFI